MTEAPQQYLTKREAAKIARVTPSTINRWMRHGKLRTAKAANGRVLIRPEWLQETIEGGDR